MNSLKALMSILVLVLLMGCAESSKIPGEQSVNESFLKNKGFDVISYEGRAESYVLTKQKVSDLPYMLYWGLQSVDLSKYFGKTINVEKFIVKNHPLRQAEAEVDVYVYEVDRQPIGGTSYPHGETSVGGYWSLEGKTLEELQDKPFQEWQKEWMNKYKD
ncbi:DUF4830 domain-containing protein [Paenibacillus sp. OV219]|uniref:DUF4830 domain-containing protein n=1 Tax=Paenibacillus sp. OV219 TaxID=1884377 RepID=UPI00210968E3|nr:DUF4830 domain-containing protein [Paenibacillus sp. OV219]